MKCSRQIYVIYFLFNYKMRQIILFFFTLSGICEGFAQTSAPADSLKLMLADSTIKKDVLYKQKANARLFPNPAKNKAELEVSGFEAGFVQLQLIDSKGNKVRDDKRMLFSGNEALTIMFSLQPGLYFIQLKQRNTLIRKKLIIE